MAQQEIPQAWRKSVCAVLKSGRTGCEILWTKDAVTRYGGDFLSVFQNDLYPVLIQHFKDSQNLTGCSVTMDKPSGITYEFYFHFKTKKTYGKVLLHTDRKKITIFSAHLPLKPKLSCD
ncbi:hypothetical protein [Phragmitibacter flavus]|uniref:hypothetical protein n=1 Tax=Phragmitibacter flavus TaxID=2576071 RepID=UPI0010FD2F3D|nr:hypothetical protein [Phragmitibacter flavus]